ncbi:oxygen-dependent choline dehydrogenase [Rhypophila decipiens]
MRLQALPVLLGVLALLAEKAAALRTAPDLATIINSRIAKETIYDFIIAGGGISGLTVADRLTEDPSVKVLVLEAGGFDMNEDGVLIPGAFFPVPYLWLPLPSVPQTALNGRSFNVPAGRVVGGGSVVNGMVFVRPGKGELRDWEQLGAKGWNWDALMPYYKKSENFTAPDQGFARKANFSYNPEVHGRSGPVQCSFPNFYFPGSENWFEAAISSGLTAMRDPHDGTANGVMYFPTVADFTSRTRSHARLNHHERAKQRPNYHLLSQYTVSRVLFKGKKAVGVEYLPTAGGEVVTAKASKEVLLAAGAVHTPQILQLSGIGPAKILKNLGIRVVADVPGVGSNFQDQPSIIIPYNFTNNIEPNVGTLNSNPQYNADQRKRYDESRTGPYVLARGLSTNLGLPPLCAMTSKCHEIVARARKVDESKYLPAGVHPTVLRGYKAQRELMLKQLVAGKDSTPVAMIHWDTANSVRMYFLRPFSRGSVTINSTDPLQVPSIDFRTMTDPIDFDLVVSSTLMNRKIMSQPTMKRLGPNEAAPFGIKITGEEELKKVLAGVVEPSSAHQCCTAAMMPKKLGGVVDADMKVYDVQGLRVIDTSFWPIVLTAAPTATTYASGEKIADTIKKAYGLGRFGKKETT